MAVKNTYKIIIDGEDYTNYAIFPIKSANLLDERLDECYISLRHVKKQSFKTCVFARIFC
ncbi:MAG: hypothetical protein IKM44_04235 [Clostridia bacterium]|nr:hypothetical protein [Clostridia bacterium]